MSVKVLNKLCIILMISINELPSLVKCSCKVVCKDNMQCLNACEMPLMPRITSDLSLAHCGISYFRTAHSRIFNADNAGEHQYPWMVSIFTKAESVPLERHICGGALINSRWIVSAAHCQAVWLRKYGDQSLNVMVGSNVMTGTDDPTKIYEVDKQLYYPAFEKYDKEPWDQEFQIYDMWLLHLTKDVAFEIDQDKFVVNTICLPHTNTEPDPAEEVWLSGWGRNEKNQKMMALQHTHYKLETLDRCATLLNETKFVYDRDDESKTRPIDKFSLSMLQTAIRIQQGKDIQICAMASIPPGVQTVYRSNMPFHGDSGSPLIQYHEHRAYIIGPVSHGYVEFNAPITYFTKVAKFIDWIKETTAK